MKLWKKSIFIFGATLMLIITGITVSAETESDDQGDVWHFVWPYWQEQTVDNQPNVDIKEIKAETSGDQITLSMTLWPGGTFSYSDNKYVIYLLIYNTSDAQYMMTYSHVEGEEPMGNAAGYSIGYSYDPPVSTAEVTVDGTTIRATMDKVGNDTTIVDLYGTAWMWEGYYGEEITYDQWHDWVGEYTWDPEFGPGDGDGDGAGTTTSGEDSDNGPSEFTVIAVIVVIVVIAAIAVVLILMRKQK